jgi:hypothetical protein
MNYTLLSMIYILIIQLVFKLHFKDFININSKYNRLEFYINKIIKANKKMSLF